MDDLLGGAPAAAAPAEDPMAFMAPAAPAETTPMGGMDAFASMAPAAAGGSDPTPSGNEAVKAWEAEMETKIEGKAKLEFEEKKKKRDAATKELNDFHKQTKEDISKNKKKNRADEAQWIKQRDAALQTGANPWERVVTLIEGADREAPKKGEESETVIDTTRMKQLLVNLKNKPIAA